MYEDQSDEDNNILKNENAMDRKNSFDSSFEEKEPFIMLVTGPNMGGKSTLLR